MDSNDVWVVVPACNEEQHISLVLSDIKKYTNNIILVDDGSKDNTVKLAENLGVIVLKHMFNLGKGAALKTGCDFALKKKANKIIVIDSDGQHKPENIPDFLKALETNDIVFSYRTQRDVMPLVLRFGNWVINTVSYLLFGLKLKDTQCGYRGFTSNAYKIVKWEAVDYFMESEMVAKAGRAKLKYVQIPIDTIYSNKYKGTTVLDGMRIVLNMFIWRLFK